MCMQCLTFNIICFIVFSDQSVKSLTPQKKNLALKNKMKLQKNMSYHQNHKVKFFTVDTDIFSSNLPAEPP